MAESSRVCTQRTSTDHLQAWPLTLRFVLTLLVFGVFSVGPARSVVAQPRSLKHRTTAHTKGLAEGASIPVTVEFTGWVASTARLSVSAILPSAVLMGRYLLIVGGTQVVPVLTSAEHFVRHYALTSISALDIATETMVEPLMLQENASELYRQGVFRDTNDTYIRVPAKLTYAAVGTANTVRLGQAAYVVGFCTTFPYNVYGSHGETLNATLRSIQMITLYQEEFPPVSDLTMRMKHISLPDTAIPRFNASCVGNGIDTIYIIGGVSLYDETPMTSVSQYNVTTGQFIDAGWELGMPLITPGVVTSSDLLFIGGGLRDLKNGPDVNGEVFVVDPTYSVASIGQFDPVVLIWYSPQLMIYNRTLALMADTYRRSFDRLEVWLDLVDPDYFATEVMIRFAPLRTNAAIASVPNSKGMLIYLAGGQIPPPGGSGASFNIFTGIMYVSGGHADVRVPGIQYVSPSGDVTHSQMKGAVAVDVTPGAKLKEVMRSVKAENVEHVKDNEARDTPHHIRRPSLQLLTSRTRQSNVRTGEVVNNVRSHPLPKDLPNNEGNWTVLVNGYKPLWYNYTFNILLSEDMMAACPGIDGINGRRNESNITSTPCLLRLSDTPACNSALLDVGNLTSANSRLYTINGTDSQGQSTTMKTVAVGPITLIGSLVDGIHNITIACDKCNGTRKNGFNFRHPQSQGPLRNATGHVYHKQLFLYVCFSTGAYSLPQCKKELRRTFVRPSSEAAPRVPCTTGFYVPLNADDPFLLSPVTHWTPGPPTPQPPTPVPVAKLYLVGVAVGCSVVFVLWSASMITYALRHKYPGNRGMNDVGGILFNDDSWGDDDEERKIHGVSRGTGLITHQKQGLLDEKYRVLRRLGRGGFSVVYLVERVMDGKRFALKYVQCADDVGRHEALYECEVAYSLQGHPNVICLVDMFMSYCFDDDRVSRNGNTRKGARRGRHCNDDDEPLLKDTTRMLRVGSVEESERDVPSWSSVAGERYLSLVMAYHEEGDLGMWVRKQKARPNVSEKVVVSIAFQILTVLQFMHKQNPPIVHRDLKPENILLASAPITRKKTMKGANHRQLKTGRTGSERLSDGFNTPEETLRIVVTDFGLSRVMDKTFCETGVGSLPYVAPECWQRCYTTKVDIWATGCILYAVCAKRVENDNVKIMFSESNKPDFRKSLIEELTEVYGYSEALSSFIAYLLEPVPSRRPSAEEALRLIRKQRKGADGLSGGATMVTMYKRNDEVYDEHCGGGEDGVSNDSGSVCSEGRLEPRSIADGCVGRDAQRQRQGQGRGSQATDTNTEPARFLNVASPCVGELAGDATIQKETRTDVASRLSSGNPTMMPSLQSSHVSKETTRQGFCSTSTAPPSETRARNPRDRNKNQRLQALQRYFDAISKENEEYEFFITHGCAEIVAAAMNSTKKEPWGLISSSMPP
uniref:non-specific serine/threonine protein kinase n=1 Tax=Trypanosoma congolense (strain IL3000) TaxID=1068625 RepID=G0ULW2_TRYCI|nr:unnamed protein product [Trypanosoma congolense IL3000]